MKIEKKDDGNRVELHISGWLTAQTAPQLGEAIREIGPEAESLILNMDGLEYISSAGVRLIMEAYLRMKGVLTLKHVSDEVRDVLTMTGLEKKLIILP